MKMDGGRKGEERRGDMNRCRMGSEKVNEEEVKGSSSGGDVRSFDLESVLD